MGWVLNFSKGRWRVGALLYGGQTFSFLAFDHLFSPYIEDEYYEFTKTIQLESSIETLYDAVGAHKLENWTTLLNKFPEDYECGPLNAYNFIKENTGLSWEFLNSALECENALILDKSLEEFSLSMREYRDYYILSQVKKTLGFWEEKWSSFYFNYKGSMRMLDLLSRYRRDYVSRLGEKISFEDKYGYDQRTHQSTDFFIGQFNPLYVNPPEEFEYQLNEDYEVGNYTDAVRVDSYKDYVSHVKGLILKFKSIVEEHRIMVGGSYFSTYENIRQFLDRILEMEDPLLIAEELMKLKDLDLFDLGFYERIKELLDTKMGNPLFIQLYEVYRDLVVFHQPFFPYFHQYYGSSYSSDVSSSDRSQDIDIMTAHNAYNPPRLFNPNCTTFSPFKSDNPICWGDLDLRDSSGVSYSNRFKTDTLSDWILAHMTCGVSNDPFWSKSKGPKNVSINLFDFIFGFDIGLDFEEWSENGFDAQFLPPNLIRGAPACRSGKYRLDGRFEEQPESALKNQLPGNIDLSAPNINTTHIKVNGKIYYGALNAILDPSNEWIISPELESIENYWNTYILPKSKKIASGLYKSYHHIIEKKLLPLFQSKDVTPSNFLGTFRDFDSAPFPTPIRRRVRIKIPKEKESSLDINEFLSVNLRDSFLKEFQMYLMILRETSPRYSIEDIENDLSYINDFIEKISVYDEKPDAFLLKHLKVFDISEGTYIQEFEKYKNKEIEIQFKELKIYFSTKFTALPEGVSWKFTDEQDMVLSKIKTSKNVDISTYYVAGGLLELMKQMKSEESFDFGPDDSDLESNLLFTSKAILSYKDRFKSIYKDYFEGFPGEDLEGEQTLDDILLKKIVDATKDMFNEVQINNSTIVREWAIHKLSKHFFDSLHDLKYKYDSWILGNKFYLDSMKVSP